MSHKIGARERVFVLCMVIILLGSPPFMMTIDSLWAWPIPDFGPMKCYNNSVEIPCPNPGQVFYGQDGNYNINLSSYTKLDATGAVLPGTAPNWAMVRDDVTGLIWENKTDNTSANYSWCNRNSTTNGGNQGSCVGDDPNTYQDTETYIKNLNDAHFGGFSDWRLPTLKELTSIVDNSRVNPCINSTYFPGIVFTVVWSSITSLNGDNSAENRAWVVDFYTGQTSTFPKVFPNPVLAVRGGNYRVFHPTVDNGDGTVTVTATGLMWQKLTPNSKLPWISALMYGESLPLAGYDDWRLPTVKELQSIVTFNGTTPPINPTYFPGTTVSKYWSSTSYPNMLAYTVDFQWGGSIDLSNKLDLYSVRAVRGGQSQLSDHYFIKEPYQGGKWIIGENKSITWDTAGIAGNVKISLSRQGGRSGSFETIVESTENNGIYNVTVSGPISVNCVLKIESLTNPSNATTQGFFTISDFGGLLWFPLILRN
jgi:hypothetical protein